MGCLHRCKERDGGVRTLVELEGCAGTGLVGSWTNVCNHSMYESGGKGRCADTYGSGVTNV